jgi:hypothetical protein
VAIRHSFGRHTPIRRPQVHKIGNSERRPKALHGTVRRTRHQACELDGTDKAEKLIQRPAPSLTQQRSA